MSYNNSLATAASALAVTTQVTGATASSIATTTGGIGISSITTSLGTFMSVAISPAVAVPAAVGALGVGAYFWWRKNRKK